jgi:hypothetical protein
MATSARCSQARIQSASHDLQAATGQAATRSAESGCGTAVSGQSFPLSLLAAGHPGIAWEQAYPGTEDQLGHVRAALRLLLRGCPMADDVLLIMHELAANAVRHSKSREVGGTFTARLLDIPGEYVLGEIEDDGSSWDGDLCGSARDASGLYLLLALSAACGVSGERWKRVVWFRLHYPSGNHKPFSLGATIRS